MKFFRFLTILAISLSLIVPSHMEAYDQIYDSGCTANSSGWVSASRSSGLLHFFKPTHNHLTKLQAVVEVAMKGDYKLSIKEVGSDAILYSKTMSPISTGKKYVALSDFDIKVTKGSWYYMHLQLLGSGNIGWYYTGNTSCDPVGNAGWDGVMQSADMWIYLWGYDEVATTTTTTTIFGAPTTTISAGATTTTTIKVPTAEEIASVQGEIDAPILTEVKKNNTQVEIPAKKILQVDPGNVITLVGTSIENASVRAVFDGKDIVASVEPSGAWSLTLDTAEMAAAQYPIEILAEKEGRQSKKAVILTVDISKIENNQLTTDSDKNSNYFYYFVGGGAFLVLVLICLLAYLIYRRKKGTVKKEKKTEEN